MTELNKKYMKDVNIGPIEENRIEEILEIYQLICPEKIEAIFISDYINKDETRELESLWLFSNNYCMEAMSFLTKDLELDITFYQKDISRIEIKSTFYDFKKANLKSRLFVEMCLGRSIAGTFKASQYNCDNLKGILIDFLKVNLIEK